MAVTPFDKKDIYEVVAQYVELSGPFSDRPYWKGKCPFHADNNPSFIVYATTQRCECRSCWTKGGDVIDFVMKLKGITFKEALPHCTVAIDPQVAAVAEVTKRIDAHSAHDDEEMIYAQACFNLFKRLDLTDALSVQCEADVLWYAGNYKQAIHRVSL